MQGDPEPTEAFDIMAITSHPATVADTKPLTPEQAGAPRRRRNTATQRDAESIQIAVTGRIFVVVARDAAQDPEWSEVTSRIE